MAEEIYKLKNVDPEDINDVLIKIQRSFNIRLDNEGLKSADTFGGLCDLIISKINLEQTDGCTTQHAFYLLRNSIAASTGKDKCSIMPHTRLSSLFPKENRLHIIQKIEQELGFDIELLQPKRSVIILFLFVLAGSFITLFYSWLLGAVGILIAVTGFVLAGKFGKEIHLKTVGDLASKISRESYLKSRQNPCTINKNEIEQKVRELFANEASLQPVLIRRES